MLARVWQAWKGLHLLLKIGVGLLGVAMLAFAVWTITPLFVNTTINEEFPIVQTQSQPAAAVASATAAEAHASVATVQPTATAQAKPQASIEPATAQPAATAQTEPQASAEPSTAQPIASTALPSEPVVLSSGSFTRIDALHGAEGSATIYTLPDGQRILRLENFQANNGPDLFIGLSGHPQPRSSAEVHDTGYLELARLKANQGNQNYELPSDLDLSQYKSVVIYCKAFSVVFSTAELG